MRLMCVYLQMYIDFVIKLSWLLTTVLQAFQSAWISEIRISREVREDDDSDSSRRSGGYCG